MRFTMKLFGKKGKQGRSSHTGPASSNRSPASECRAKYGSGGMLWDDLDNETKALARQLRELIDTDLLYYIDKVLVACPAAFQQTEDLQRFYADHAPEIISTSVDCVLTKQIHHFQHLYPDESVAFVVTVIHNTIEGAKQMLLETSRFEDFGYMDLVARFTDQIPKSIGGMYHLIFTMSLDCNHFSVNLCMLNLANRNNSPIDHGITPNSLLTDHERSELGV